MRSFLTGLGIGIIGLMISFFVNNSDMVMYSLFIIGFIPMVISGFMTGAYVSICKRHISTVQLDYIKVRQSGKFANQKESSLFTLVRLFSQ